MKAKTKEMLMIDLSLFADYLNRTDTSGTVTPYTANGLTEEMKTYYEKRLIDTAEPMLIHDQFGDKYPIPKNGGKTIEFRRYSSLPKAVTPLTEGITPDGQSLDVSTIEATVGQYGGFVRLTDMLEMAAIDNNVVQATKVIGSQAGRTLDTIVRDILVGGTNVIMAGGKTTRASLTASDKLTVDLVFKAAAQLEAMNAPKIDGSYVGIIHPYVAYDIMSSDAWLDVHKYADPEAIFNGEIGKIGNVRFVSTSEAKIWNDSAAGSGAATPEGLAVFGTLILGANAYGVTEIQGGGLQHIVKPLGAGEDPLNQRSTVGWKATKTAERLVEEYMVRIESCSAYSSTAKAN